MPVHHSNCSIACATSMSRPPMVWQPARRGLAQQAGDRAGCRRGRRPAPSRKRRRGNRRLDRRRGCMPIGVQFTSRSQRAARRRPLADRAVRRATPPLGARADRAHAPSPPRRRDASATATARADPPAPRIDARRPGERDAAVVERLQEAGGVGVAPEPASVDHANRVQGADPATRIDPRRRRARSSETLNGIVTLAPFTTDARARTSRSRRASAAGSGR